jgi:glycine/D-amino acid oxidase-like deaminating enzyme
MDSFWERDAMLKTDCLIIGGGLIGLLTALAWRDTHPSDRIVVLERGIMPFGASSRNAGFACFGSLGEIVADISTMGEDAAITLVTRRWEGLRRLRSRVDDSEMDFENEGGHELLTESQLPLLGHVEEVNDLLMPLFGKPVFYANHTGLTARQFGPQIRGLVSNVFESQLHSGKLMRALFLKAASADILMYTGAVVDLVEDGNDYAAVKVAARPGVGDELIFRAQRVAICTNGASDRLFPETGIVPARGQIVVTEELKNLSWRGCHHFDQGFYYFRNVGNRILLGGARNRDLSGEQDDELLVTDIIQAALENFLEQIVVPDRKVRIDYRWAGLMGFSADKQPIVKHLSPRIVLGFGCNGMGVALSAEIAAQTAALLA